MYIEKYWGERERDLSPLAKAHICGFHFLHFPPLEYMPQTHPHIRNQTVRVFNK